MSMRSVLDGMLHMRLHYSRRRYAVASEMDTSPGEGGAVATDAAVLPSPMSFFWRPAASARSLPSPPSSSAATSSAAAAMASATAVPATTKTAEMTSATPASGAPDAAVAARLADVDAAPTPRARRRQRMRPAHQPRLSAPSAVIPGGGVGARGAAALQAVQEALPARHGGSDWQRIYSTMEDGASLQTLYNRCAGEYSGMLFRNPGESVSGNGNAGGGGGGSGGPIILVMRDSNNAVFGCYASTAWKVASHYYGNGETFVFALAPRVRVFRWARGNAFFQLATADSLALGGGGNFALFLDSMLERGSSRPCPTFDSPGLAATDQFDVVVLEAYRLVPPHALVPVHHPH